MSHTRSPLISIVLPVYNGANTIAGTVESVLDQLFADFELLIINDGSTDATLDVLARVDNPRVSIHSFENRGLSASRNRGIRLAGGKYVSFIDADDLWTPDKLRKQLQALVSNPDAGMAYSLTDCIDEQGNYLGPGSHVVHFGHVYEQLLARNFIESGSNSLIPLNILDKVGLFDESLNAAEDWDFFLRICHDYPVVCVPEAQILYRIHSHTMSSNIERQENACVRVFEEALERLPRGAERDRVDREGRANLNRYFARRVITTASGQRAVLPAFGYISRWVSMATDRFSIFWKVILQLFQAIVLAILPHPIARPLLVGIEKIVRNVRKLRRATEWTSYWLRISPVWWVNFGPVSRKIGTLIEPAGKPLLIVSLPRSGSSWVGETLAQAGTAAYLREPVTQTYLSIHPKYSVFEIDPGAVPREYRRLSELAFGGIPRFGRKVVSFRSQWRLGQRSHKRIVIKEVNPLAVAYWQSSFDSDVIFLVRHPAAVAASLQAMRWSRNTFGYWFPESSQAELMSTIRHTRGSSWAELGASQAIIHEKVRELMDLTGHIKLIRYEDICTDPLFCFRELFAFAGFEWDSSIESFVQRQTTSHGNESQGDYSTRRNSASMPDAWKSQLADDEIEEVRLGYLGAGGRLYDENHW
ncbi:MAG: glycosyltransferase [Gammaproteobacteria bacterium]|jgi:glycosyltransferase involved in cell wall biosynthesis|nr:glycosyltransferase [Gammaproteobacteria bacterium]